MQAHYKKTVQSTVLYKLRVEETLVAVISDLKKKCMKRPAEKSCSTKQSNGDDGDDDVDEMDGNDDDDCGGDDSENGDNVDKLPLGRKLLKLFKTSSVRSEKHFTTRDDTMGNGEGPTKKTMVTESFEKDKSTNVVRKETVETVSTAESPITANTGKKEQLTKVRDMVSCKECTKARYYFRFQTSQIQAYERPLIVYRYAPCPSIKNSIVTCHYNNNNNNNNNQSLIYAHIYIRPTAQEQKNSVQVIRNTAHRPSTQASYTASRVRLNKENQPWRRKLQPGSQYHFLVSAR